MINLGNNKANDAGITSGCPHVGCSSSHFLGQWPVKQVAPSVDKCMGLTIKATNVALCGEEDAYR